MNRADIVESLVQAGRVHQRERGIGLLLRSLKWVWIAVVAGFAADVWLHLSPGWRLALVGACLSGSAAMLAWCWYVAHRRAQRLERVARLLETREASLGSRLINLLQLEFQTRDATLTPLTRSLAQRAIAAYAEELAGTPFAQLARTDVVARELKRAAFALAVFAGVLAVCHPITRTEIWRFGDPFGDHPAYSLTQLELIEPRPAGTNVIYGRSFLVQVKPRGHRPKELFLTACPPGHPEQALTLPMFDKGSLGFHQQLDNIRRELIVLAHTKDKHSQSKHGRIGVILTPQLEKAYVQVSPPAYTGIRPAEKPYAFKGVQALAGSEVRFRVQSNRPLRQGLLEILNRETQPITGTLARTADNEVTGTFTAQDSGRLRLSLVDADGIPSLEQWESALTVTHDLPPEINITDPARDGYVALDFTVMAQLEASDDYGLRMLRIHRGLNGVYSAPKEIPYTSIVRAVRETAAFNFRELGVQPGDVVSFFAEALDTAPEPHLARSRTIHLMVISVEDYNDFLREQTDISALKGKYDELVGRLQELAAQQKKLGEEAQAAREQLAKSAAPQNQALQQTLDGLLARQYELNQKLKQHAEAMDHFVREHPLYDIEEEFQRLLREQAQSIRDSAAANDQSARQVARRSNPAAGTPAPTPELLADFKAASDEQLRRLGMAEQTAQNGVGPTLDDLSAMQELVKDFNQFRALYESQQTLTDQARAYNRPGQLQREDQLALKEFAGTEKQVDDLLAALVEKLRADAQAAEKLFPKAARSGRDLASQIEEARLRPLARRAADKMLAADGEGSFLAADRLREEMEKLFKICESGRQPGQSELDDYLRLTRALNPGQTFAQMMRSRNFMRPGSQQGSGYFGAAGDGLSGDSGYAVGTQQALDVLGNETFITSAAAAERAAARTGLAAGKSAALVSGANYDPTDTLKNLNPVNRQSGSVVSESLVEEYSDVMEKYFQAITK